MKQGKNLRVQIDRASFQHDSLATDTPFPQSKLDVTKYPISKLQLDQLFLQWLSISENEKLVFQLLEEAKEGKSLRHWIQPTSPRSPAVIAPQQHPLSPNKSKSGLFSPLSPVRKTISLPLHKLTSEVNKIPQFYFPNGPPIQEDFLEEYMTKLNQLFAKYQKGMPLNQFGDVVHELCEMPKFFSYPLFKKIAGGYAKLISKEQFLEWWETSNILAQDPSKRMFLILQQDNKEFLTFDDFKPLLKAILEQHPGLDFLQSTAEFQEKYAQTVIYRIFYSLNKSDNGKLTLRQIKRSDILKVLQLLQEDEDINKEIKYFSYEHFYVIYCKFWELDLNHDFLLAREDMVKYGNFALSYRLIERIFEEAPRKFRSGVKGKMNYEDFVWFILSEEDKTTDTGIEYWFKCLNLDQDGVLKPYEMQYFYEEQKHRIELEQQEQVLYEDLACQIHDMIQPRQEGKYSLQDFRNQRKYASIYFNIMFNYHKFMAFEMRDPFMMRSERDNEDGTLTDWGKFASLEYRRLSMEEDVGEDMNGSKMTNGGIGDIWEDPLDKQFQLQDSTYFMGQE